jgi:hypothetical protein
VPAASTSPKLRIFATHSGVLQPRLHTRRKALLRLHLTSPANVGTLAFIFISIVPALYYDLALLPTRLTKPTKINF